LVGRRERRRGPPEQLQRRRCVHENVLLTRKGTKTVGKEDEKKPRRGRGGGKGEKEKKRGTTWLCQGLTLGTSAFQPSGIFFHSKKKGVLEKKICSHRWGGREEDLKQEKRGGCFASNGSGVQRPVPPRSRLERQISSKNGKDEQNTKAHRKKAKVNGSAATIALMEGSRGLRKHRFSRRGR